VESRPAIINDAVRQAVASVQSAARAKAVQIRARVPEEPVIVLGDSSRLRQIIWQLLSNAIKFTPRGGTVDISVEANRDEALVTVRDSGQGIDPDFLPRVFERFTQADASTTRVTGGLGVGLALVRELVEIQGGEVEAENRPDASGSIFRVRFPVHVTEAAETLPAFTPTLVRESPPLDGLRVLVLDQDREGRELVRTVLQQRGALVQTVSSVGDALEALEGWHPDILVTDSVSPEHDSYAVIGKVPSLDSEMGGRIPAMVLTSASRTDQKLKDMVASAQSQVPKPLEPAALAWEIARLAGRERRRAQR
jgi:CheY-like chemotaxis protein/anti-sigma regulatory factor (Ser/Thr protein kinase)